MEQTCNFSIWEIEARGLRSQPQLHRRFEATLSWREREGWREEEAERHERNRDTEEGAVQNCRG